MADSSAVFNFRGLRGVRIEYRKVVLAIAVVTALLSITSWTYRTILELSPYQKVYPYILFPVIFWLLFAGPLFMTQSGKKYLRILAGTLLVPTSLLWVLSVLIGFFGLKIH